MNSLAFIAICIAASVVACDAGSFDGKEREKEIAEEDTRVKSEVAQWDKICEACKSKMTRSLPVGMTVLDWRGMCAPSKTSTGHSTGITALVSGNKQVSGVCFTDKNHNVIDFSNDLREQ